jgi:transformer-2 protein
MNPSPCRVLGVFGLSLQTDERDIRRVFEKYGRLDKVKLVTDPRVSNHRDRNNKLILKLIIN